ncbi:MAG: hypothetical protein JRS35_09450 [Deltaproteobacteria bacterium]|nr:hypothetical protein [Deltaproteobacteria bacterium]
MPRSRRLAAFLMLLSGLTHVSQLAVYGTRDHVIGAAIFGFIYFAIGALLLGRFHLALWLGAILPAIGAVGGIHRFASIHANPFSIFHVAIDLIVVPICVYWLIRARHFPFVSSSL